MDESNEKIKVTDRRINFEENQGESEPGQESEARKIERKRAAEEYKKASAEKNNTFPRMDFSTFVLSLSSSALTHLGEVPDPGTGQTQENLPMAKQTIDLLAMLEEKTRGNLTPEEARLLKDFLFEVRMKYVQKAE